MRAWKEATRDELSRIQAVCLDIDDTFSSHGKIKPEAFSALWALKDAEFVIVPITGRPAGWCDHIARFWPVDAVVGENGAFTFYMEGGVRRRLDTPGVDLERRGKLTKLHAEIVGKFPFAKVASDQAYRENDLAIDICEDVSPWKPEDVEGLLKLCHAKGVHAKLSSIHVNVWFGEVDKRKGFEAWVNAGCPGAPESARALEKDQWLYIGDSPNDEPMFQAFSVSVGVANLKPYLNRLKCKPTFLTDQESGSGFSEMAERLLARKS